MIPMKFSEDANRIRIVRGAQFAATISGFLLFYCASALLNLPAFFLYFILILIAIAVVGQAFFIVFPFPWHYSLTSEGLEAQRGLFRYVISYGDMESVSSFHADMTSLDWDKIYKQGLAQIYPLTSFRLNVFNSIRKRFYPPDLIVVHVKDAKAIKWPFSFLAFSLFPCTGVILAPSKSALFKEELEKNIVKNRNPVGLI